MQKKWGIIREILFIILSFIVPFTLLIALFSVNNYALFSYGEDTIIMIDMQSEYIAYMRNLKQILLNNDSLIYTNTKVFGGDYLSIFTFYLSSPFNLFVVFFPDKGIPLFFLWSSIIKMSLAGLNFYFLTRFTSKFSYHKILFAVGYGLISYSLIYMSNYMWLDGVMILPLVILGLHFLKDKKHLWLYPLAICYSLLTSWYIGFMICVFATLYFIYLFIAYFKKENLDFLKQLMRFFLFSLIGGFLAAPYWLTAFIHLSGTKGFAEVPKLQWFSISIFLSGLLENNYVTVKSITQYRSYISMFVGVIPLVFFITFFFNKEFKLRDRLALLGVFLFYFIFSSNTITTALLHGGKEPTWFPGRYSFIIGFIVLYTASRSLDESYKLHPLYFSIPALIGIITLIVLKNVKHSSVTEYYSISGFSAFLFFITIIIGIGISLIHYLPIKEEAKKAIPYLPTILIFLEIVSMYRGSDVILKANKKDNAVQSYETYLKDDSYQQYFDKIKQYEKEHDNSPFYRMEATFNRPGNYNRINNNPMFYSYNGLSNYSSSSKKEVESYLWKLGFHYNYFFAKYEYGSTYSINSLLGVKYILQDESLKIPLNRNPSFLSYDAFNKMDLGEEENINYYYNPNVCSLGFVSDETTSYFINEGNKSESGKTYWFDHLEYQNQIFKTLDNSIGEDIFKKLEITLVSDNITYTSDEFGIKTFKNVKDGDVITYKFTVPMEAMNNPCYFGEKDFKQDISFFVNGYTLGSFTYHDRGLIPLTRIKEGENTLRVRFNKDFESISVRPELYYEDLVVAKKYLSSLNSNSFQLKKVNNSSFKKAFTGEINVTNTKKDLIFTIPFEDGVQVYVDGKQVKAKKKLNIFTAISLNNVKEGVHKVTIQYVDQGLILSMPLFIIAIFTLPPLLVFYDKIEGFVFKKRKKEKN